MSPQQGAVMLILLLLTRAFILKLAAEGVSVR